MDDGDAKAIVLEDSAAVDQPMSPASEWLHGTGGAGSSTDSAMRHLDEIDRKILSSVTLNVEVIEVYSPERINTLARKFGLVPGASLDLTN